MVQPRGVAQERQLEPADVVHTAQSQPPRCHESASFPGANDHVYDFVRTLAEGSYGDVHECVHVATGQRVAIKRFKAAHMDPQIWRLAMRELRVLQTMPRHPNVVQLKRAVCSQSSGRLFFVFELLDGSLYGEMGRHPGGFLPPAALKLAAWQLLQALAHCHDHGVVHRDVKPANVLVKNFPQQEQLQQQQQRQQRRQHDYPDEGGDGGSDSSSASGNGGALVKLCDFGFARWLPGRKEGAAEGKKAARAGVDMSAYVVTRWYRPPEVLVDDAYGTAVDIWSYGCTLAELASGQPLFPGCSSADQLWRITRCLGPLPPGLMAKCRRDGVLAAAVAAPGERGRSLAQRLKGVPPPLLELITACLELDPNRRRSARELMKLPYFWDVQRPALPGTLPTPTPPTDQPLAAAPRQESTAAATRPALAPAVAAAQDSTAAAATPAGAPAAPRNAIQSLSSGAAAADAEVATEASKSSVVQPYTDPSPPLPPPPLVPASAPLANSSTAAAADSARIVNVNAMANCLLHDGGVRDAGNGSCVVSASGMMPSAATVATAPSSGGAFSTAQAFLRRSATAVIRRCHLSAVHAEKAAATTTGVTDAAAKLDVVAAAAAATAAAASSSNGRRRAQHSRASRLLATFALGGGRGSGEAQRRLSGSFVPRGGSGGGGGGTAALTDTVTSLPWHGMHPCHVISPLSSTSVTISASTLRQPSQRQPEQALQPQQPLLPQPLQPPLLVHEAPTKQEGMPCIASVALAASDAATNGSQPGSSVLVPPVAASLRPVRSSVTAPPEIRPPSNTMDGASEAMRSAIGAFLDESRLQDSVDDELYGGDTAAAAMLSAPLGRVSEPWGNAAAAAAAAARATVVGSTGLDFCTGSASSCTRRMPTAPAAAPAAAVVPPLPAPSQPIPAPVLRCQWRAKLEGSVGALSSCNSLTTISAGQLSLICSPAGVPSPSAIAKRVRYETSMAPPPPLPLRRDGGVGGGLRADPIPVRTARRYHTHMAAVAAAAASASLSTGGSVLSTAMSLSCGGAGGGGGGGGMFDTTSMSVADFLSTSVVPAPTVPARHLGMHGGFDSAVGGGGGGGGSAPSAVTGRAATANGALLGASRLRCAPPRADTAPTQGLSVQSTTDPTASPSPMTCDSTDVRPVRTATGFTARRWNAAAAPPVCITSDADASMGRCYITKSTAAAPGRALSIGSSNLAANARIFPGGAKMLLPSVAAADVCLAPSSAGLNPGTPGRRTLPFIEPRVVGNGGTGAGAGAHGVGADADASDSSGGGGGTAASASAADAGDSGSGAHRKKHNGKASRRLASAFQALRRQMRTIKAKALAML